MGFNPALDTVGWLIGRAFILRSHHQNKWRKMTKWEVADSCFPETHFLTALCPGLPG